MNNRNKPQKQAKASNAQAMKNGKQPAQRKRRRPRKKKAAQISGSSNSNLYRVPRLPRDVAKHVRQIEAQNLILDGEKDEAARNFAMHAVNPKGTAPCGIPSQEIGMARTGLWPSEQSFDVNINFDPAQGANSGRFGFIVRPDMGDASDPSLFKIALVDNSTGWPTGFAIPPPPTNAPFVRAVGRRALTVDPASRTLLQPPATYYEAAGTNGTNSGGRLGFSPLGQPAAAVDATFTVDSTTDDLLNPNLGAAPIVTFPAVGQARVTLPPGQFLISIRTVFAGPENNATNFVFTPNSSNVEVSKQDNAGGVANQTECSNELVVSVYQTAGSFDITWSVPPSQDWNTDLTISSSWARPDQLSIPATGYPKDGGPVRKYVPVAMSVLCTFIGTELTIGGDIAAAVLPGGTCGVDVFTNQPRSQAGNPLLSEDLRDFPQAHDGNIREGAYVIWTPESKEDMILRTPSENSAHEFPCVAVSGHLNGGTGTQALFRVTVNTTYQYTSDIQGFDLQNRFGSQESVEAALRLVQDFPKAGPNGSHWQSFKDFANKVGVTLGRTIRGITEFVSNNKGWIMPLFSAASAL